jgi:hypothetical protein
MGLQETLKATAEWFKAWVEKQDMRAFTIGQIQEFESKSRRAVAHADQDLSA